MNLTNNELDKLKAVTSATEFNAALEQIKAARNGQYPPDWFAKVVLSGLMGEVSANW